MAVVPIAVAAGMHEPPGPQLIVQERGELVAIADGRSLYASAERPSSFVTRQWTDAFRADVVPAGTDDRGFACEGETCLATAFGLRVAVVDDAEGIGAACDVADIVVTPRRIATTRCRSGAWVLNGRRTGERGSASIDLAGLSGQLDGRRVEGRSVLARLETSELERHARWSLPADMRPWTRHRYAVIRRRSETDEAPFDGRASGSDE